KTFGLSQARGVLSAILHAGETFCVHDAQDFSRRFEFVYFDEAPLMNDHQRLYDEFARAQETCAVVFGPMYSGNATYLFNDRAVFLKVPTILTTASSTRVREHKHYGKLLFQLSANIDDYSGQLVQYLARFQPKPAKAMLCVYTDDEYGRAGKLRLQQHATAQNLAIRFVSANVTDSGAKLVSSSDLSKQIEQTAGKFTDEQRNSLSVVVIAVKDPLRETMKIIRDRLPSAVRAT